MRYSSAEEVVARFGELEPLPEVVSKALRLLTDSRSGSQDIARAIGLDHALTGKVLLMANSAHFGTSRRFVNLTQAVVRLGYRNIHSALCAAAASSSLSRPITVYGMGRYQLWKHSVACAICSRIIAVERKLWDAEEAYIAGLLHDIGLPALEKFALQSGYQARLIEMASHSSYEAEETVLRFNHAFLGSLICEKWQLAPDLVRAVSDHHDPSRRKQPTKLAAIVHLADVISLLPAVGVGATRFSATADPEILKWLDFDLDDVERVASQVRRTLDESKDFVMGMT